MPKSQSTKYEGIGLSIGLIVVNLIIGIGIPIIVGLASKNETDAPRLIDSFILGVTIVAVLTVCELLIRLQMLHNLRRGEVELWKNRHDLDMQIHDIRELLHELQIKEGAILALLVPYYRKELEKLRRNLTDSVGHLQVTVDNHHIETASIAMAVFDSNDHDTFRATLSGYDGGTDISPTFILYFHEWMKRVTKGKVKHLKRLFIYSDAADLKNGHTHRLAAWHNWITITLPQIEAKAVSKRALERQLSSRGLSTSRLDIGIYSTVYVYTGDQRHDETVIGSFSRDPDTVRRYQEMFDALWESSDAQPLNTFVTTKLPTLDVFKWTVEPAEEGNGNG